MQTLTLRDGRTLAYAIYGDPAGRPLFFFHGFPGSRLQAALIHEQAQAARIRVIAPDRPGFGASTPAPDRTIRGFAYDVEQLADHLGHARLGVLGISCGGPYALACAHKLARRIDYVGLLAGMGPMDIPALRKGQHPMLRGMFAAARIHPALITPILWLDRKMFRQDAAAAVRKLASMLTPPDRALVERDAQVVTRFGASLAEAYAQGIGGAMREAQLIASPRDFPLDEIRIPVHVYQGSEDRNVPPRMGRYLARKLSGGQLHPYPGEGHLSIVLSAFPDCAAHFSQAPQA